MPNDLDMIQAAGCKFVRMDCTWDQIETHGGPVQLFGRGFVGQCL